VDILPYLVEKCKIYHFDDDDLQAWSESVWVPEEGFGPWVLENLKLKLRNHPLRE
jgi:hypothetical protein